jgi:hypothetical protein
MGVDVFAANTALRIELVLAVRASQWHDGIRLFADWIHFFFSHCMNSLLHFLQSAILILVVTNQYGSVTFKKKLILRKSTPHLSQYSLIMVSLLLCLVRALSVAPQYRREHNQYRRDDFCGYSPNIAPSRPI